jgi:predicted ATPase
VNPVLDKDQHRIFISYRRSGNGAGFALGLYEGLRSVVGAENVFFDVSEGSIKVGHSWRDTVRQAIARCNTLLVIVDDLFEQTIAREDDPLRIELECALELNVRLAPVYIGGVKPPSRDRLPESLRGFPELHASRIRLETSPADMQSVIVEVTGKGSRRHEHGAPGTELKASTSRMPVTGREVFGREEEMARLTNAWTSGDTNVVCLVAWGGVGKSALMNHWMRSLGKDFAGAERVYAWSFFSQGTGRKAPSGDVFVDISLSWFGDLDPTKGSPWERGERLAQLIRTHRTLLFLDGLEPLQFPPGPEEGRVKDTSVQALLRELSISNPGLCVISTRLPVADLEEFEGSTVDRIDLDCLSPQAGAQLLRALKVTGDDEELEAASREFNGHSLALTLLGSYLADVFDGDIARRSDIGPLQTDMRFGGHARRVMESYEAWFGDGPETALLRTLGLFDRPASPEAIADICLKPAITGLTDFLVGLAKPQYRQLLARLRRAHLLLVPDPERPDFIDTHPLIREHFREKLQEEQPAAWREANSRLFDHYSKIAREFPDNVEEMEPLFQAMKCGCRAGRETDALRDVYLRRIMRGDEYFAGYKLGSLNPLLGVLSHFFEDDDWTSPIGDDKPDRQGLSRENQLTVLTHVGWFLTATQSYAAPEAGRVFAFAETLCRDDTELFPVVRGLWVYRLVRADLDEADRRARRLLEIGSQSGSSEQLVEARLAMGLTSVYKGDFNLCREHLQACLDLYDPVEHHINSFKYGNDPKATALAFDGFAAWLLGRPELAVSRCADALKQAESVGHPFTITLILYVFTMVYQAIGDVENTRNSADRLIAFCKSQGSSHFLSQGMVFRAWAEFRMGGGKPAVDKMHAGLKQHLETGAIVTHTYHTALLAEALAALGSYDHALGLIRDGLKMIEKHGDRRWLADLHRVHGDLLAAKPEPEPEAALAAYNRSLDVARAQSAKSFELRTLVRMVRLLAGCEGAEEAAASLARAYEAFDEGRDTADLKDAEALLAENNFRYAEAGQPIS